MNKVSVVISGHGNFATGMASALTLLGSLPENYYGIDFTSDMSDSDLAKIFKEILVHEERVVFFTDLLGGTPYKEAARLATENEAVEVVTGCNLGALLETAYTDYQSSNALAEDLVAVSHKYAQVFVKEELISENDSTDFSDGI